MWSQMGELVASAGPLAFVALLSVLLIWTYFLVAMVLTKSVRPKGKADVSVRVRLFPWPRIEVDVRESG
ncbi:hypothetical protein G7043_09085 [Lentzea sp. NEAU-D13]|uniref:Uncharacterized protein n=1 Tax=Lentzea alba TaxID=2714351 RepID=A0A7C9VWM7_9PSEU|nr:hypothetical protein [Lentzea alba]NGY59079.1 hypothetical protein [Lentzea alba]